AHQGGLAGAVLAQQRVDLAAAQLERNVIIGLDTGELFGDVQHLNDKILCQWVPTPFLLLGGPGSAGGAGLTDVQTANERRCRNSCSRRNRSFVYSLFILYRTSALFTRFWGKKSNLLYKVFE